ncbi:DUF3078 domain-containing protein [Neolewinella lacunae]|uniref:DUF3078 domain-containing protein n=1 Tax=Neolewinella lacunae TaxID=1517758 RepID=A0A923PRI7_9BACT|nr:DUF3078 domain-containing protein [Neolewinella lacunae]MBC6996169.1 DUF3078 domain-containing protein [Neolewinella lacunae]MDN3634020.1 DUF3078 domain-containing protein [Neolewinella lacunae]
MNRLLLLLCTLGLTASLFAQEEAPPQGWQRGAGLGLDFSQLLQINPKQGAGQNRLGFGGAANYFANYRMDRRSWESTAMWQFGVQRLGTGIIAQGSDDRIPFQKAIDELRLNSKYGIQASDSSKLFWTANAGFLSQVTPTYQFPDLYPGNFISDFVDSGVTPLSKFLAPATLTFSVGIDYKANENFSIFFSPISSKFIIVADDVIASRGVHGNPVSGTPNEDGIYADFENVDAQLGALAQMKYADKFASDKATFTSTLNLYTNYLRNPENVDLDWVNALGYELFKNFQLNLLLNVFYDDDVLVQITDYDEPNGVRGLGKRVSITQQLLLTYSRTF